MQNIAMYTRLSVEDDYSIESESIVNQKSMIENFIKSNFDTNENNIISYSDDGFVGSDFERPALKRMIEDVKNGKINCIIVKDLSRFGRDYIEVSNYLDKVFPFLNVRFIAINDNYDSNNNKYSTTDLDIAFKNILYSYYSKDLSVKVKTGLKAKAKQGNYISSYAPFGYKKNKDTKRLEIDEETAPIVKMIFDLYYNGHTKIQICKKLNEEKVPIKSYFKIKNLEIKPYYNTLDNKIWRVEDLKDILKNEIYIGNTVIFKKKRIKVGSKKMIKSKDDEILIIENNHEPIISKEVFYKCMPKKSNITKPKNVVNIFRGKLKCGNCCYCLRYSNIWKDKKVVDKKYFCITKRVIENLECSKISITETELKQIIFECLKKEILINLDKNANKDNIKTLKKNLSNLTEQLNILTLNKKTLYEDYLYKKFTKEKYLEIKKENEMKIDNIKKDIESLKLKIMENKQAEDENKTFKQYLKADKLTKTMLDIFVKNIYIFDKDNINIEWNLKKE